MTMLRRFSGRLRQHDWTAVIVDLAIVVLGVFLGIQAANWNEARQARQQERRYYGQLIQDLRADLETLATAERHSRTYDRAAENVISAVQSGVAPAANPARLAVDFHHAGFLYLPRPARRTYDELISTGNLRLLRDEAAKKAVTAYYARFDSDRQWDDLIRQHQNDYWTLSAGVVPRRILQAAIRFREPEVTRAEAQSYVNAARQRPVLADLLVGMAAHQERVRRDSELHARRARELIEQLEPLSR